MELMKRVNTAAIEIEKKFETLHVKDRGSFPQS